MKGRQLLRYLIECAIADDATVRVRGGGVDVENMQGAIGLAPAWLERGLSVEEKRWVSACLYARTNHFGVPVPISMRAELKVAGLAVSAAERDRMTLFEGGFFGNFFAPERPAYACTPDMPPPADANVMRYRICTLPESIDADGNAISACGFIVRGPCSDPDTFDTDEGRYEAVIHVYLNPDYAPPREAR